MKNKEKQIEELTRSVGDYIAKCNALCNTRSCHNCELYGFRMDCHNNYIAKGLYEQGYQKIDKDSVVLSREEFEVLAKTAQGKIGEIKATDFIKACLSSGFMVQAVSTEEQVKQASKETAEKFARDIFNHIITPEVWEKLRQLWLNKDGNFKANKHIYDLLIEPVAKQFGVEIKE